MQYYRVAWLFYACFCRSQDAEKGDLALFLD